MGQTNRHVNTRRRLRGEFHVYLVDADGESRLCRWSGVRGTRSFTTDPLTEIHNDRAETVEDVITGEQAQLTAMCHEFVSAALQSIRVASGRAPTIVDYQVLERMYRRDDLSGLTPLQYDNPYGIPQTHDSTNFPPATGFNMTDSGAGTLGDATWYGWVVPAYLCQDPVYGPVDALTKANLDSGALIRGFHYTVGTPVGDSVATAGGSSAILYEWTAPTTGPRPTHFILVLGTANDITDASSHIAAVVEWGTASATITAVGTTDFGAAPSLADLNSAYNLEETASQTDRVVFDPADGTWTHISQTIADGDSGTPRKFVAWRIRDTSFSVPVGGGTVDQDYRTIRVRNARSADPDPATRRATSAWVDLWRVNVAQLQSDLIPEGEGWHAPLSVTFPVLFDPTRGELARLYGEDADLRNFVDFISGSYAIVNE